MEANPLDFRSSESVCREVMGKGEWCVCVLDARVRIKVCGKAA